jgi:DNA-binding phage protein
MPYEVINLGNLKDFDSAEFLTDEESRAAYLAEWKKDGEEAISRAEEVVSRSRQIYPEKS